MKSKKTLDLYMVLSFFIPFFVILIGMILGGFAPFGNKDIFTVSGNENLVQYYYEYIDGFKNGTFLFFSKRIGNGYDFSTVFTYYLSDPFNLMIALFPKGMMFSVLNIFHLFKSCFAGLFLYIYLLYHYLYFFGGYNNDKSVFSKKDGIIFLSLSLVYSLSGYLLSCGMNPSWSSAVVVFPLVMLGLEKLYLYNNPKLYIIFFSILCILSFNIAIIVFIFSIFYLFIFEYKSIRHFLLVIFYKVISDAFILGICFLVVYNNVSCSFFHSDHSFLFPSYTKLFDIKSLFVCIFGQELYVGIIVFLLFFIYVINRDVNIWKKIRVLVLLLLLYAGSNISTINYFFAGFSSNLSNVYLFCLVFFIITICFDNIQYLKKSGVSYKFIKALSIVVIIEMVISGCIRLAINGYNTDAYENTFASDIQKCIDDIKAEDSEAKILLFDSSISNANPLSNYILCYDYVIRLNNDDIMDNNLSFYKNLHGLDIYFNPDVKLHYISVPKKILEWNYDSNYVFSTCNNLTNNLYGIGDLFKCSNDNIRVVPDLKDKTFKTTKLVYSFEEPADYYVNLYHLTHLGWLEKGEEREITYHVSALSLKDDILSRETVYLDNNVYCQLLNYNSAKDDIRLIPYDLKGCHIIKNDEITLNDITVFDAFSEKVTIIPEVDGQISCEYKPYKLYRGIIVSLISILLFILITLTRLNVHFDVNDNNIFERLLYKKRIYIYTFIISVVTYIIILFVNQCIPFGVNSPIISDGFIEDYPTNMRLVADLKAMNFYDVDYSLGFQRGGVGISSYFTYLLNPLRIVLFLFPDSQGILAFNILYALEFVLIGQTMLIYLIHRPHGISMSKSELKLIPIALSYNFSSFVLCYYSFAGFLDLALILPLIMLALDRLIYDRKYIFYTLIMAYYMIVSTYFAFLLCIFLFLYFFTLEHENIRRLIKNGLRFAVYSVISAGIASFTLLSFYGSVTNSGYIEQDSNVNASIDCLTQNLIGNLTDFEVLHRICHANSDFTIANTYAGLLLLLTIPLFIFIKNYSLSSRIRRIVLLLVLYLAYGNELLNYVFHGFHFQSLVPNRFSIFFIFLLVISFYDVVCNYTDIYQKYSIIVYSVFSVSVLLGIYYFSENSLSVKIVSVCFIMVYFLCVFKAFTTKQYYKYTRITLFIFCLEIIVSSFNTIKEGFKGYTIPWNMISSIEHFSDKYNLNSTDLKRASLVYDGANNIAAITGYNTADIFSSTLQSEQINLADTWGISRNTNFIAYHYGNPLADIMTNTRYFFITDNSIDNAIPTYLEKKESETNMSIYENPYVGGFGIILPDEINLVNRSDYNDSFSFQNDISKTLIGEELYTYLNPDLYSLEFTEDGDSLKISLMPEADIEDDVFISVGSRVLFLGNNYKKENNPITEYYELTDYEKEYYDNIVKLKDIKLAIINTDNLNDIHEYVNKHRLINVVADGHAISGDIDQKIEGYLYFSIPSYGGWNIELDGKYIERNDVLDGVALRIPVGSHHIELTRINNFSIKPYILSLISICIFLVIVFINLYSSKKDQGIK